MTLQADQIEAVFNEILMELKKKIFECQCPELVEGLQFGNIELKIQSRLSEVITHLHLV